jgi:hypothetical protein
MKTSRKALDWAHALSNTVTLRQVDAETTLEQIANQLVAARGNPHDDSPIFQLIEVLRSGRRSFCMSDPAAPRSPGRLRFP